MDWYQLFVDVSNGDLIRWQEDGAKDGEAHGFKMPSFPKSSNGTDGNDVLSSIRTLGDDYTCTLNKNFYTFFFRDVDYGGYTFGYITPVCQYGRGKTDLKAYYMTCGLFNNKTWNDRASSAMGYFW